jgi:predicted RNA-binding protein Jag
MLPAATTTAKHDSLVSLAEDSAKHLMVIMGFDEAEIRCSCKEIQPAEPARARQHLHVDIAAGAAGRMLIGAHGAHLEALQHVVRTLIRRRRKEPIRLTVDVNGYLASREQTLLSIAEEAARKAGHTGRAVVLPPMTAAQRRLIHTALAAREDISTASLGTEPNRRVVVRPVFI